MSQDIKLERTEDRITAGMTNIPLTYPAKIWFVHPTQDTSMIRLSVNMFDSMGMGYDLKENKASKMTIITSQSEIERTKMKMIWRNFRSLHPKFISDWRYLLWEIDNRDAQELEKVIEMYRYLDLPLYIHKSMRGYHFISVKPIQESAWRFAVKQLRPTNEKFPAISVRILANKYINEVNVFLDGYTVMNKKHSDTLAVRSMMEGLNRFEQDNRPVRKINPIIEKIAQDYQVVWYAFDGNREDNLQ